MQSSQEKAEAVLNQQTRPQQAVRFRIRNMKKGETVQPEELVGPIPADATERTRSRERQQGFWYLSFPASNEPSSRPNWSEPRSATPQRLSARLDTCLVKYQTFQLFAPSKPFVSSCKRQIRLADPGANLSRTNYLPSFRSHQNQHQ